MKPMNSSAGPADFGRVDPDGTVYVRTADGERAVGQIPDVSADEALAFYVRRFEALEVEVALLEARIGSGALSPDEAKHSVNLVKTSVTSANAVGDLAALAARLEALAPAIAEQSEARKAERAKQAELGVDQAALDEAARRGFAMGAFEDVEYDGLPIIEEFFSDAVQDDVPTSGPLNASRTVLRDKLSAKANRLEPVPAG